MTATCRECLGEMPKDRKGQDQVCPTCLDNKLIKVTLEYPHKIQTLEGEEANRWMKQVNSHVLLAHVHGQRFPMFNWQITRKE